jgi:glycine/D-amino acid oxidase-like deaminating enzyme
MSKVIICGAGIAGVSAAYHLSVKCGIGDIMLVDERAPLSLTSDQSTECYRNWWPGPGHAMVGLMNRSIDIMEALADESGNRFQLNRRGYLYCTTQPEAVATLQAEALVISKLGAGPLRVHRGDPDEPAYIPAPPEGYHGLPDGADLLLEPEMIRKHFPYISADVRAALHTRRAGWFSAQQMGMYMLEKARHSGVQLVKDRVIDVEISHGEVAAVHLANRGRIVTKNFVNAAGPFIGELGEMLGLDLPVYNELHLKAAFKDSLGILHRAAPLAIFKDRQTLKWDQEELKILEQEPEMHWLLEEMPSGLHIRPEGGPDSQMILVLWEYQTRVGKPEWPVPIDPLYAEVGLRGLVRLIPEMQPYLERMPRPHVDGGYYTKTRENRPLIGKLPVAGAYIIGALSGFGLMAGCGAGELLAARITGRELPAYAPAFSLERYEDPTYQALLEKWDVDSGQL